MAIVWPAELPTTMLYRNVSGQLQRGSVRTQMDAGPAYTRARFTAAPRPYSGSLMMTGDQLATFDSFWRDTLKMGSLPFEWYDPRNGNSAELVRFTSEPRISPLAPFANGAERWSVQVELEVLPELVAPNRPDEFLGGSVEILEWGPWFHAFDASPAGAVDASAAAGQGVDAKGASGGGMDFSSMQFEGGAGSSHGGVGSGYGNSNS